MRGVVSPQVVRFSLVDPELLARAAQLQRVMKALLRERSTPLTALYAEGGRPSMLPEQLVRALMMQELYSGPSERSLMEQLEFPAPGRHVEVVMRRGAGHSPCLTPFDSTGIVRGTTQ